ADETNKLTEERIAREPDISFPCPDCNGPLGLSWYCPPCGKQHSAPTMDERLKYGLKLVDRYAPMPTDQFFRVSPMWPDGGVPGSTLIQVWDSNALRWRDYVRMPSTQVWSRFQRV